MDWQTQQRQLYQEQQAEKERLKRQAAEQQRLLLKGQFQAQAQRLAEQTIERERKTEERQELAQFQQSEALQRIARGLERTNQERDERLQEARKAIEQRQAQEAHIWISQDGKEFRSPVERDFWNGWLESGKQETMPLIPQFSIGRYRVDFAHVETLTAIEIDGYKHHSDRRAFVHDRIRERWLEKQGWHVVRFSGSEIAGNLLEHIEEVYEIIQGRSIPW